MEELKEFKQEAGGKGVALLVEDNEINAEIATMQIKELGFEVEWVANGARAVERFGETPVGYYSIVVMDIMMPVMDGLEATKTIRALNRKDAKTVPIIAMTANAFDEDVQRSLQVGMDAHLSKPVEPDILYLTLAELIYDSK